MVLIKIRNFSSGQTTCKATKLNENWAKNVQITKTGSPYLNPKAFLTPKKDAFTDGLQARNRLLFSKNRKKKLVSE